MAKYPLLAPVLTLPIIAPQYRYVIENRAGGSGDPAFASHNHGYQGRKKITIYNGLKVGESVAVFKQTGGQLYYVASRIFPHTNLTGQWG